MEIPSVDTAMIVPPAVRRTAGATTW